MKVNVKLNSNQSNRINKQLKIILKKAFSPSPIADASSTIDLNDFPSLVHSIKSPGCADIRQLSTIWSSVYVIILLGESLLRFWWGRLLLLFLLGTLFSILANNASKSKGLLKIIPARELCAPQRTTPAGLLSSCWSCLCPLVRTCSLKLFALNWLSFLTSCWFRNHVMFEYIGWLEVVLTSQKSVTEDRNCSITWMLAEMYSGKGNKKINFKVNQSSRWFCFLTTLCFVISILL